MTSIVSIVLCSIFELPTDLGGQLQLRRSALIGDFSLSIWGKVELFFGLFRFNKIDKFNRPRPSGPFTLINPTIISKSDELISLWDDCMSFPFIMVRKQRHASVSVQFVDDKGKSYIWEVNFLFVCCAIGSDKVNALRLLIRIWTQPRLNFFNMKSIILMAYWPWMNRSVKMESSAEMCTKRTGSILTNK